MTREEKIEKAVVAAAASLWPFTLSMIGLPALLRGLMRAHDSEWNKRTFAGEVRRYFYLLENR